MNGIFELSLARSIERKIAKALAEASQSLVPPGTLGAGVSITQTNDTEHVYDPVRGVLTVIGTVRIEVRGLPKAA
jgi:hypothetical protein